MRIYYRKATKPKDIGLLIDARINIIEEDSGKLTDREKEELFSGSREYIKKAMKDGSFFAYLAFDSDTFAGTCSVNLYRVLPGRKLPKGKRAYLQNVYVVPSYRGNGIAKKLVALAVDEAKLKGHERIELHASEAGKPLFEKCGFKDDVKTLSYMVCN